MIKITEFKDKKSHFYDLELKDHNIDIYDILTDNDRFKSYKVKGTIDVEGNLFVNEKPSKKEIKITKKFISESIDDYNIKMDKLHISNYQWILNIIDGKSDEHLVLKHFENFILSRDYVWKNYDDISQLHLLAITTDKTLRSVRDLSFEHVDMLKNIKSTVLEYIESNFKINSNRIKIMFHYPPSTYILHIHFIHIDQYSYKTSFERCISIDDVIFHLENKTNYFQKTLQILS